MSLSRYGCLLGRAMLAKPNPSCFLWVQISTTPETLAVFRLNSMRQNSDRFADFLAKFERTIIKTEGSVWTDSVKKNFLINTLSMELQKAIVTTAQPDLYVDYVSLLHTVSTNLEMLRKKKKNVYTSRTKAIKPETFPTSTSMD